MNDLIQQIEGAIKRAREVANEGNVGFGGTSSTTSVRKAKIVLAQAHLEQALRVLEEN